MELLPYIRHYLFLDRPGNGIKKLRLFSDGNNGLVFSFKNEHIINVQANNRLEFLPKSFVYGQISNFKELYSTNGISLIIVVFHPFGISRLSGISANSIRDKTIGTEDIFGIQGLMLHEKLCEQSHLEGKLKLLNTFFTKILSRLPTLNNILIQASLSFIVENNGTTTIGQLVKHTGYTERHIERTFSECIGINPKKFGNIVKLHVFLKLLKNKSKQNSFTHFCYGAGYSDQSHLIKEFRKYTGITPTQYLKNPNRLAVNLMEINSVNVQLSDLYNSWGNP